MNIGMLWFDNDPKAGIQTKIERAASYYRTKYGATPNLCFVNPKMLPNGETEPPRLRSASGDIEVRSSRSVLPNHFWLGVHSALNHADS